MIQPITDFELRDMKLNRKQYTEMAEFNRKTILKIQDHLPGELTEEKYYELFRDDYGGFPFYLPFNTCLQLRESLRIGYWQGERTETSNKNLSGILLINGKQYHGYSDYGKHQGHEDPTIASQRQQHFTTLFEGKDLANIRADLNHMEDVLDYIECITGHEAFSVEIIRQSEEGNMGCKETMFTIHQDTDGNKMGAILTAVTLLTNTTTSMQILGKLPVSYTQQGHVQVFPSTAYHCTKSAQNGTMKMSVFLRARRDIPSDIMHTNQRVTRSQMRYRQPKNRKVLLWGLDQYVTYISQDERAWRRAKDRATGTKCRSLLKNVATEWSEDDSESSAADTQEDLENVRSSSAIARKKSTHELISPLVSRKEKMVPKQSCLDTYIKPIATDATTLDKPAGNEQIEVYSASRSADSTATQFQIPEDDMVMFQQLYYIPHLLPKFKEWIKGEMNTYISSLQHTLQTAAFSPRMEKRENNVPPPTTTANMSLNKTSTEDITKVQETPMMINRGQNILSPKRGRRLAHNMILKNLHRQRSSRRNHTLPMHRAGFLARHPKRSTDLL